MAIEIVTMSPQAEAFAKAKAKSLALVYPFDDLQAGQSFTVPKAEANLGSLRAIASRKSKGEKRFVVIKHEELGVVEVARVA